MNPKTLRHVRIYDNGGKTFDRYTAVYMNVPEGPGLYACRGMSAHPNHPQGFGLWSSAMPGRHLGRRIKLEELPEDCQKVILADVADIVNSLGGP